MDLMECAAMSQGYIGYHLQQGIQRELRIQKMPWHVATVVTQTLVDAGDEAFQHPTKPIGAFYTKEEADQLKKDYPNFTFCGGFRQGMAEDGTIAETGGYRGEGIDSQSPGQRIYRHRLRWRRDSGGKG